MNFKIQCEHYNILLFYSGSFQSIDLCPSLIHFRDVIIISTQTSAEVLHEALQQPDGREGGRDQ